MYGQQDNDNLTNVQTTSQQPGSGIPITNHPQPTPAPATSSPPVDESTSTQDLLEIKEKALRELKPLVQHLDLSPEDKFKTTMMMIQASDNPSLLKSAYEITQNLTDNELRAQALLDIVNEINYFTHVTPK